MDTYKTIGGITEGCISEQRSKFISLAIPVQTVEKVKEYLDFYRKRYSDARHVCWAYMLGHERTNFRVNDDGEPSSTAGKPILGVINSNDLTDILIVVIRYFGGVKLGTGGLIFAYRAVAQDAIRQSTVVTMIVKESLAICFEYASLNGVMKIIKEDNPEILFQQLDMRCELVLSIRKSEVEMIKKKLSKIETLKFLDKE